MKHNHEMDNALRELVRQRDKRLGAAPVLPPGRQALLTKILREKFPLESAIRQVAIRRDRSLNLPSTLPAHVEWALQEQIAARRAAQKSSGPIWQRFIRSPFAAALTVSVIITAAAFFGFRDTSSRGTGRNLELGRVSFQSDVTNNRWVLGRAELFSRKASIRPFDLNQTEPASLQVSFFTNSGMYFADETDARLGLRLDLPVRAILVEQDLARTP